MKIQMVFKKNVIMIGKNNKLNPKDKIATFDTVEIQVF